jgi:hypothetical protein
MLDTIFTLLYDWRAANKGQYPRVLHIGYRWFEALRRECDAYRGILPICTPLTVFGMWIQVEYHDGPWMWIS